MAGPGLAPSALAGKLALNPGRACETKGGFGRCNYSQQSIFIVDAAKGRTFLHFGDVLHFPSLVPAMKLRDGQV